MTNAATDSKHGFRKQIEAILTTLTLREEKVLRLRFKIGEEDDLSYERLRKGEPTATVATSCAETPPR